MSVTFVVDACMAFAWTLPSQASAEADELLEHIEAGARAIVPSLWFLEVANGLLAAQRRRLITVAGRESALEHLSALAFTIDEDDARNAFGRTSALAEQFGLSVYDAAYLELALRHGLPLATRDGALRKAAERGGVPRLDRPSR